MLQRDRARAYLAQLVAILRQLLLRAQLALSASPRLAPLQEVHLSLPVLFALLVMQGL